MGNLAVKPNIPNAGADRFYDMFAYSFRALNSDSDDYLDILRVLSTQLQYVPSDEETFHLSINGRHMGNALLALSNALMGDKHVSQLSVESAGIDEESLNIMLPVLHDNKTLKELYLTGNNFGATGVKLLTRALIGNSTLETLHIGCTACGDEGAAWVADLLTSGKTGLRRIDMSANSISEAGLITLSSAVDDNESIVELQLRDNGLEEEALAPLQERLKQRFKPYMEELRKEQELRRMLRKSSVGNTNSGSPSKSKLSLSLKQRLKAPKKGGRSSTSALPDKSGAPQPRGQREGLLVPEDPLKSPKSRSAPSSPRLASKKGRVAALIGGGSKPRGLSVGGLEAGSDSSDEESVEPPEYEPEQVLLVHVVEAARLKPVQKNGVSDPFCHSFKMCITGRRLRTSAQRKTLSPQWKEWFEVAFDDLEDWTLDLLVQDDKIGDSNGFLGRVTLKSAEWDLSSGEEQVQWLDIIDGLGAVRVGLKASPAALPRLKEISVKRKAEAQKLREARESANQTRAGRPRGRTMLAPPKAVLKTAATTTAPTGELEGLSKVPHSLSARVCVGHAETIGRRPTMEDAVLLQGQLGGDEKRDLFAVFDGHGSAKVAIHCAQRLGEVLLPMLDAGKPPLDALRQSFLDLSAEVSSFAINMGCTAVAALLQDGMIYVANCGDTRAVLCSSAGVADRLTVDHKPSLPEEIKRIEALGGFVRNGRVQGQLAVSRALGDANFAPYISSEPYLRAAEISEEHSHLVLACDGLWDVFPDSLAGQIVANQPAPAAAASMLRDRAFASGSTDNISVVVIQLTPTKEELAEAAAASKRHGLSAEEIAAQEAATKKEEAADFGSFDV